MIEPDYCFFPSEELNRVPLLRLPGRVLFPKTALYFQVKGPRQKELIREVLSGNRLVVISGLQTTSLSKPSFVASLALLVACHRKRGHYALVLEGLQRVRCEMVRGSQAPCLMAAIQTTLPLQGTGLARSLLRDFRDNLLCRLQEKKEMGDTVGQEWADLIENCEDPEVLINLAGLAFLNNFQQKQQLLEANHLQSACLQIMAALPKFE